MLGLGPLALARLACVRESLRGRHSGALKFAQPRRAGGEATAADDARVVEVESVPVVAGFGLKPLQFEVARWVGRPAPRRRPDLLDDVTRERSRAHPVSQRRQQPPAAHVGDRWRVASIIAATSVQLSAWKAERRSEMDGQRRKGIDYPWIECREQWRGWRHRGSLAQRANEDDRAERQRTAHLRRCFFAPEAAVARRVSNGRCSRLVDKLESALCAAAPPQVWLSSAESILPRTDPRTPLTCPFGCSRRSRPNVATQRPWGRHREPH